MLYETTGALDMFIFVFNIHLPPLQELSTLLEENNSLQHKLVSQEEDFHLQNRTLMKEINRVCQIYVRVGGDTTYLHVYILEVTVWELLEVYISIHTHWFHEWALCPYSTFSLVWAPVCALQLQLWICCNAYTYTMYIYWKMEPLNG